MSIFNNHRIDKEQDQLVEDVKELCVCCARGIVLLAERYRMNPKIIAKLFIEVFQQIIEEMDKA